MGNIIVAIACNLVAALILFSGIFSATRNGWKVSLTKFILTLGGGVGAYFLTPVISNKLYAVEKVPSLLNELHISVGTANSCLFLLWFLLFYAIILMVCNIVKHCLIKKLQEKSENRAKMRRARSINPKAEKVARRTAWKALKAQYRAKNRWWKRLISGFIGAIVATVVGIVVLVPYKYIAADINHNGDKAYLEEGYDYTLNGLIDDKIEFEFFDWLIHNKEEIEELPEGNEETPEVTPDEEVTPDVGGEEVTPEVTPDTESEGNVEAE